jgi:hypothetical protein
MNDHGPSFVDRRVPVMRVFDLEDRHFSFDDARVGPGASGGE